MGQHQGLALSVMLHARNRGDDSHLLVRLPLQWHWRGHVSNRARCLPRWAAVAAQRRSWEWLTSVSVVAHVMALAGPSAGTASANA